MNVQRNPIQGNPVQKNLVRLILAGLIMTTFFLSGCRQPAAPVAPEKENPYNTRFVIEGRTVEEPTPADLYPNREKPIVKIIKGEVLDEAEAAQALSQQPRQDLMGMSEQIRSLILRDVPVRQITELLTDLCGYNVVPTKAVEDKKINIYMQEISLRSALETICRLNDLWYREGHNIVTLMTREEYIRDIEIRQNEHTRAFSIKYTNAADMAKIIQALMGSEVYLSEIEDEKVYGHVDPEADIDLTGRYEGPDLDNTSNQRIIFMDRLINDRRPDHTGSLKRDTVPVPQTAGSSAEASSPAEKPSKPLLAILTVFKRNNSIIARSLDESLLNEMARIIETLDTPTSQVLLEVKILQITLDDEFESFFQFDFGDFSDNPVQSRIDPTTSVLEGFGVSQLPGAVSTGSTGAFSYTSNNIEARISFFEEEGRVHTVSSPFLMSANNSSVDFFVGEEVPLRDDVKKETIPIGEGGDTLNTFIVEINREELGTEIIMSTFINEDNTVTLEIEAEISSPVLNVTSIGLSDDFGNVIDFPLDGVNKSEIKSILTAKSGQTIALGGIIRETMNDITRKVPGLGDIPGLGFLFRQENDTTTKTETIIVLTPHVIAHPGFSGAQTRELLNRKSSNRLILEERDALLTDEKAE
ncbi:MAG: hypothetical protein MI862_22560 [Desulfobacterales bacterium]|nr:hypothetical protein [Desulfobacterales bacterium]